MSPNEILLVILTVVAMRPFIEVPDAQAKAAALKRGGYKPSAKMGCLYALMIPVLLPFWWWYAIKTDALLLGVIPSVGMVATIIAVTVQHIASKVDAATPR